MVYESDFYTTRRPYSRPTVSSYSVTRRPVNWDRHPMVPRPSQVPLPHTAFGRVSQPVSGGGNDTVGTHRRVLFHLPSSPVNWRY